MPRIYTKTGDDGTTGLLYGGRISKDDAATEAYGTTDEAVAVLGLARALGGPVMAEELLALQRGALHRGRGSSHEPDRAREAPARRVARDERHDRTLTRAADRRARRRASTPRRRSSFPARTKEARLGPARSVIRRAERQVVALEHEGRDGTPRSAVYLNRLSDLVFVLARRRAGEDEPTSR